MAVLELRGVAKTIRGRKIVEDINMTVEPGEVYGFLGPNGAGKTTTIRMIVGLIRPTAGTIRINGRDVQKQRAEALRQVGTIVENPETYKYLTGRQNLVHYARLAGVSNIARRIEEVNEIVGLGERLDDKVKRYSLGMRQRLGVAQALLGNPKLLVLDEPTNGLDPAGMREFRELMRRLADAGMAVFVSSHLLSELEQMCDRVAIIKAGRLVAEERMEDLVNRRSGTVRIRVNDPARALAVLQQMNRTVRVDGPAVLIAAEGDQATAEAVRRLVEERIDIFSVEPDRDSLEDLFLELTEGKSVESLSEIAAGGVARA
jgi:ABC-2 type transport system ATP-binding protein